MAELVAVPAPAPVPSPESAGRLADSLMKVSVLDDLEVRRLCVVQAMELVGAQLSVPEFDEKKIHLVSMVRAFGEVPDGWRHLTDAVKFLADYDLPSQRAAALAHPVLPPVIEEPDQQELAGLLAGIDRTTVPQLPAVYHTAAGEHFGPLPENVHTAWDAYQLLAHTNRPAHGAPRSVRFLQELAVVVTPERGDPIRTWVNRQVRRTAPDGVAAQRILDDSRARTGEWRRPPPHPAHLLFRMAPCTGSPALVDVTCWSNSDSSWQPRRRDDRTVAAGELQRHVASLLDREESRLRTHRGGVVLEFILPLSMVNEPVEEWSRIGAFGGNGPWESELGGPPLWQDYPIVLRSLERIEALHLHRVWNDRWDVLADGSRGARAHRCGKGDGSRHHRLYARLAQDPAVVLMSLGSPPDDEHGRIELLVGLQAGLPVLVWSRAGSLADQVHTVAEEALGGGLDAVMGQMTRLRFPQEKGDDSDQGFSGSGIAVLWDDPNRLPELPQLLSNN